MKHSVKYCMKGAITYFSFPVKIMKIAQVSAENAVFLLAALFGMFAEGPTSPGHLQ